MALVVETGAGLSTSEVYDSLVNIAAGLAKTGEDAGWLALTNDTVREQVARRVTRYIDTEYNHRGQKKYADQALEWPKVYAYDDDGNLYANNAIPTKLKTAFHALCGIAAGTGGTGIELQPTLDEPAILESESIDVGPISISESYQAGRSAVAFYRKVDALLSEIVEQSEVLERA